MNNIQPVRLEEIEISKIQKSKFNINKNDQEYFLDLKENIKFNGLVTPIEIYMDEDGYYKVLSGATRLRAFKELYDETGEKKYEKILSAIHDNILNESTALKISTISNDFTREGTINDKFSKIFGYYTASLIDENDVHGNFEEDNANKKRIKTLCKKDKEYDNIYKALKRLKGFRFFTDAVKTDELPVKLFCKIARLSDDNIEMLIEKCNKNASLLTEDMVNDLLIRDRNLLSGKPAYNGDGTITVGQTIYGFKDSDDIEETENFIKEALEEDDYDGMELRHPPMNDKEILTSGGSQANCVDEIDHSKETYLDDLMLYEFGEFMKLLTVIYHPYLYENKITYISRKTQAKMQDYMDDWKKVSLKIIKEHITKDELLEICRANDIHRHIMEKIKKM